MFYIGKVKQTLNMKTTIFSKLIFLFLPLLIAFKSDKAVETHVITLYVNTTEITRSTIDENADFGQQDGSSNEDYTIEVFMGDTVQWVGESSSDDADKVEIVQINYQSGERFFNSNVLNGSNGVVTGTITQGRAGRDQKYNIKFRITRNGQRVNEIFQIDPKIVLKQR